MKQVKILPLIGIMVWMTVVQAAERKNVAVLDLETRGAITREEAMALTDRLRSILVRTNAFNVVDRGKMEAILEEVGFQQSGCTSTECAVEVGKILNVEQMISGSIGKIGSMYTIDIVAIDVQSSAILNSFSRDYKGEIEGLIHIMEEIAGQLSGRGGSGSANGGSLLLTSNPDAALVYIDGKAVGKTPLKVDEIAAGEHKIKVVADGFKDKEGKIIVQKGKTNKYSVTLKKKGGKTWLWLGTTTIAAAGGTAAYVMMSKKKNDGSAETSGGFPAPPGRP